MIIKMSHKTLVKLIFVTFLFNNFPICTANDETEPSLTTGSSRAEKLTSSASPVSSSRTENEAVCVPREKRDAEDAEMALAVRLEWQRQNFYDGEMAEYYEENSITEWDLYSFFHDVIRGRPSGNFTMIKGVMQNETFHPDTGIEESGNYLKILDQMTTLINSINNITNQHLLHLEGFKVTFDQTDDCLVKFIIYVPWNEGNTKGKFEVLVDNSTFISGGSLELTLSVMSVKGHF